MAQPGTSHNQEKATKEARTAKLGISQKQHKAIREASKAKRGTSQKQEKATREAPEAQLSTSHSKATGVKRNLSDHFKSNRETPKDKDTLTDIRMAILPENYPESSISQEQAEHIRN
ncbi:hypothetical protein Trydic_g6669 [Trypoxylus dichotomus]